MSVEIATDPPDVDDGGVAPAEAPILDTVTAAQKVLSKRFGAKISLADPEDLGGSERSIVLRVRVAETPFSLPRTMVLKRYLAGAADSFVREAVSYQLFTALAPDDRMCPELFAHDGNYRLLVLEDLGRSPTLADKLLGDDARVAERALLSWARSLGRLHATTAGREADFDALSRRLGQPTSKDPLAEQGNAALAGLPALLADKLGVTTSAAVLAFAERSAVLLETGRHRAFSPSDSCPDNNLLTSKGVRFLDFEGGCVRNMLFDAAYLRVPFPSCWCAYALPQGMTDAMLAAWRAEVSTMWPDLDEDTVLLPKLLEAQLFWVWLATWRFLQVDGAIPEHDPWVDGAARGPRNNVALAARWHDLAVAARRGGADDLAAHADSVVTELAERYGANVELPLYPAFR